MSDRGETVFERNARWLAPPREGGSGQMGQEHEDIARFSIGRNNRLRDIREPSYRVQLATAILGFEGRGTAWEPRIEWAEAVIADAADEAIYTEGYAW